MKFFKRKNKEEKKEVKSKEEQDADLTNQLKAFEEFETDKTAVQVATTLKLSLEKVKIYEKMWKTELQSIEDDELELKIVEMLEDKNISPLRISKKLGIPVLKVKDVYMKYQQSLEDFEDLTKASKRKEKDKKEFESPYRVMKSITHERYPRRKKKVFAAEAFEESPTSEMQFLSFVEEFGNGEYTVVDNRGVKVSSIHVTGQDFDDPSELEEYEEGGTKKERWPANRSRYPAFSGDADVEEDAYNEMVKEDDMEQRMLRMADLFIERGMPDRAERTMQRYYKWLKGIEGSEDNDGKEPKGWKEWLHEMAESKEDFATLANMFGFAPRGEGGGGESLEKAREYGSIIRETIKTAGDSIVTPLLEHIEGEKDWQSNLDDLIDEDKKLGHKTPLRLPEKSSARGSKLLGEIVPPDEEERPVKVREPEGPKLLQTINPINDNVERNHVEETEDEFSDEDIYEDDEDEEDKEKVVLMANPLSKLKYNERVIINKIVPQLIDGIMQKSPAEAMATSHFEQLISLSKTGLVSKQKLVKAYEHARQGYDYYIEKYQKDIAAYMILYEPVYEIYADGGIKNLMKYWVPPEGVTYKNTAKYLRMYEKLRAFYALIQTSEGKDWITKYQLKLVELFQSHFGHTNEGEVNNNLNAPNSAWSPDTSEGDTKKK